jgi:large subunit ribosomal protein L24
LNLPRLDGAFSVSGGQARWGTVVARGEGADLAIGGIVDLADWTMDARLTLSATAVSASGPTGGRPEIFLGLKGPIGSPSRVLDVAAFSGWLTLRAVERQSKRLELLQSERPETVVETSPAATSTVPGAEPNARPASPGAGPETQGEPARPRVPPPAAKRATTPSGGSSETAPPLPPPIDIKPQAVPRAPAGEPPKPRENNAARPPTELPPPPPRRSLLDQLFGSQR